MGMFDTFWGSYRCENCGIINDFEEQTYDYDNCLLDFYLGDYMDAANKSYYYRFEHICKKCKNENKLAIVIRNGQYVDVVQADTADNTDINCFNNIEDGYQRNIDYRQKCEKMLGEDERIHDRKFLGLHKGNTIRILEHDWVVDDIIYERDKDKTRPIFFEHRCFVLFVHGETCKRVVNITYNNFTKEYTVKLDENYTLDKEKYVQEKCDVVNAKLLEEHKMYKAFKPGDLVWFSDPYFGDMKCVIESVKECPEGVFYDIICGEYTARNIIQLYLHKRNE